MTTAKEGEKNGKKPVEDKTYSGDDLRGIVHQRLLEQRMEFMENSMMKMAEANEKNFSSMQTAVARVTEALVIHREDIQRCRDQLRDEVERDFMTKQEGVELKSEIKAINTRLILTGATIVILLSIVNVAVNIFSKV